MAWLEVESSGIFHIVLRFGDRKFKRSLRTTDQREAEAARVRIEENIRLVERERLTLSSSANVATFLLSDGKLEFPVSVPKPVTIRELFARYRGELPAGSLEPNSLATIEIHLNHLERLIGKSPRCHRFQRLFCRDTSTSDRGKKGDAVARSVRRQSARR